VLIARQLRHAAECTRGLWPRCRAIAGVPGPAQAEAALFAGDADLALEAVAETEAITGTSAPPAVQALLHRIRGHALGLGGQTETAARELEESLRIAREGGMLYEQALTLRARAKLTGSDEDAREAQRIFHELDVVDVAWLPWAT
jgi:hypothetical protein